ncbi:MAG: hypothetical protein MJ229_08110, partial [bacterium]|nr:hypothetical protein [bacterium]
MPENAFGKKKRTPPNCAIFTKLVACKKGKMCPYTDQNEVSDKGTKKTSQKFWQPRSFFGFYKLFLGNNCFYLSAFRP